MPANLNSPAIVHGPLTASDLRLWRRTGQLCPPCTGCCEQGRYCPANACATEGGTHHDPAPTEQQRPGVGLALVLLGWPVVAVIGAALAAVFWPH